MSNYSDEMNPYKVLFIDLLNTVKHHIEIIKKDKIRAQTHEARRRLDKAIEDAEKEMETLE